MNLDEILDGIGDELGHNPTNPKVRAARARQVNDVYLELLGGRRWKFLVDIGDLVLYPPVQHVGNVTMTYRKLTFGAGVVADWWVGQKCSITTAGGFSLAEAEVLRVNGNDVWIDQDTALNGSISETTFTIAAPRWRLPSDCADVLGVVGRGPDIEGEVPFFTLGQEHGYSMNSDEHGTPGALLMQPPAERELHPRATLVGEHVVSGGTALAENVIYRLFYVYSVAGRLSGRSNIVSVTLTRDTSTVRLSGLEDWSAAADERGIERHVYAEKDGDGGFYRVAIHQSADGATLSLALNMTLNRDVPWVAPSPAEYVRPFPQPGQVTAASTGLTTYPLEVRYQRRYERLREGLDTPLLPSEHHVYLVYRTAERIAGRDAPADVRRLNTLANDQERIIVNRYLVRSVARFQKRGWSHSGRQPFVQVHATLDAG